VVEHLFTFSVNTSPGFPPESKFTQPPPPVQRLKHLVQPRCELLHVNLMAPFVICARCIRAEYPAALGTLVVRGVGLIIGWCLECGQDYVVMARLRLEVDESHGGDRSGYALGRVRRCWMASCVAALGCRDWE
jgi:hypothetical protein